MCGIFGLVGKSRTTEVLKCLKKLEYRGYDSCGIVYKDDSIHLEKEIGKVDLLIDKVVDKDINLAIAHTRWATNGCVKLENTHPLKSVGGNVILAHNGIIENIDIIKDTYMYDVKFSGDTDSEVLATLLEIMLVDNNPLEAIKKTMEIISGTYAVVFMISGDDMIYYFKNKSPLVLASGLYANYISSDISALPKDALEYMYASDKSYGCIGEYIYSSDGDRFMKYEYKTLEKTSDNFNMINEIKEEPELVFKLIDYVEKNEKTINFNLYNSLVIIGAGSSYYAGLYIAKLYEKFYKKHAYCYIASEFNYERPVLDKNCLYLLISQSGETIDILDVFDNIESSNIALFTNNINSSLASKIPNTFDICAGKELGVAATKSYNQTVLLAYLLFTKNLKLKIDEVYEYQKLIKNEVLIPFDINNFNGIEKFFFIGKGFDYIASLECALKVKEINYIPCEGYSASELKHGTLSLVDDKTMVIGLTSQLNSYLVNTLAEVSSRNGKVEYIKIDKYLENLGALVLVTYGQLLAYNLAVSKGLDPDFPRNLAKSVTVR